MGDEGWFKISDGAGAIDISVNTVRSWLQSGAIGFHAEEYRDAPRGGTRLVSMTGVLRLAIMAELVRFGIKPQTAWSETLRLLRGPGELYPDGRTFLIVLRDRDSSLAGELFSLGPGEMLDHKLRARGWPDRGLAALVDVSKVIERTSEALGRITAERAPGAG